MTGYTKERIVVSTCLTFIIVWTLSLNDYTGCFSKLNFWIFIILLSIPVSGLYLMIWSSRFRAWMRSLGEEKENE